MKYKIRFLLINVFLITAFACLLLLAFNKIISDEITIGIGAAAATIYFGLIKGWIEADSIRRSLFESFNERFEKLSTGLNAIKNREREAGKYLAAGVLREYLNLCAEEYYWFERGRISKKIWRAWSKGIDYYVQGSETIFDYFEKEAVHNESYYGFLSHYNMNKKTKP